MKMQEIDIHDYARQLLEAHGDKAVVEAAQKASTLEKQGDNGRRRNLAAHRSGPKADAWAARKRCGRGGKLCPEEEHHRVGVTLGRRVAASVAGQTDIALGRPRG